MKNDVNRKATLLFIAFLLILIVAGAIWYFLSASQFTKYQIHTQDSVSGLIADAPVEFHGVDVGKVESIEIVNSRSVSILVSIRSTAPITSATVATITARGLARRGFTGYVYIALEDVGTDYQRLVTRPGERYPTISIAPSKSVTLDTTIFQVNENVQILTGLLQSILDKNTIASLKQSVDSLQQVTKILADNSKKLNSIISNTERASYQLKPLLESSNDTVRTLQTQTLPEAHKALTTLDNLSNNQLKPLLDSSNDTVRALQTQILPEAHKALTNLDNLSRTLTGVATKINRDPSILIRGTAPLSPGPGEAK
jgi:phospholipid/cholesterol/gamma-HCH transport system substrate-binding protein